MSYLCNTIARCEQPPLQPHPPPTPPQHADETSGPGLDSSVILGPTAHQPSLELWSALITKDENHHQSKIKVGGSCRNNDRCIYHQRVYTIWLLQKDYKTKIRPVAFFSLHWKEKSYLGMNGTSWTTRSSSRFQHPDKSRNSKQLLSCMKDKKLSNTSPTQFSRQR